MVDRLDAAIHAWRPYLRALLGVPVVHLLTSYDFNLEMHQSSHALLTLAMEDNPHLNWGGSC